ncbi:ash family protein [Dryocola boscaweniae]
MDAPANSGAGSGKPDNITAAIDVQSVFFIVEAPTHLYSEQWCRW